MVVPTTQRAFEEAGQRDTKQRRVVREHLAASTSFVTAQQLHDGLRLDNARVGLATVYRTLQAMVQAGEVDAVRSDSGETLFRKCGPRHHHHLVCRVCGVAVEVDGPGVERWAASVARDHGFTDVEHVVELFGLCATCSAAHPTDSPDDARP